MVYGRMLAVEEKTRKGESCGTLPLSSRVRARTRPMAEYCRTDRPPDKPDKENAERLEDADQGTGLGEKEGP